MSLAVPPLDELVNTFEFETVAGRKLDPGTFAEIAGSDRTAFDRITFRPRMMVNTTKLDLSLELFGQRLFAPIIVGPVSEQKRFHPDGELAMVRGASAAKAAMVVSGQASESIDRIAAQSKTVLWYQVYPHPEMLTRAQEAVKAGCKAVFLTLGASRFGGADWSMIDRLRSSLGVPLVLKGIMNADDAKAAVTHGVQGMVVSNYTGREAGGMAASLEALPAIAGAVGGRLEILVDGGFRRGSDILKALALGARAVLLGRPPVWALTAYGADGVQRLLELLQTELARDMAMCGRVKLGAIEQTLVKVHKTAG
jgi:isopentenyl diphosphate isomerase/L-lactate dehydrogenase-like FMN-dependent dehydrogenase